MRSMQPGEKKEGEGGEKGIICRGSICMMMRAMVPIRDVKGASRSGSLRRHRVFGCHSAVPRLRGA